MTLACRYRREELTGMSGGSKGKGPRDWCRAVGVYDRCMYVVLRVDGEKEIPCEYVDR